MKLIRVSETCYINIKAINIRFNQHFRESTKFFRFQIIDLF